MLADGRVKSGACTGDVCATLAGDSDESLSVSLPHDSIKGISINPIKESRITRQLMSIRRAGKLMLLMVLKLIVACSLVFMGGY